MWPFRRRKNDEEVPGVISQAEANRIAGAWLANRPHEETITDVQGVLVQLILDVHLGKARDNTRLTQMMMYATAGLVAGGLLEPVLAEAPSGNDALRIRERLGIQVVEIMQSSLNPREEARRLAFAVGGALCELSGVKLVEPDTPPTDRTNSSGGND